MKRLQVPLNFPCHLMNLLVGKARKNAALLHLILQPSNFQASGSWFASPGTCQQELHLCREREGGCKAFLQQVPGTRPAAQARGRLPSGCSSSLCGSQVFRVSLAHKKGSKATATLAGVILRRSSSVPGQPGDCSGVTILPLSPGLRWWLVLHFQSSRKLKSCFTDTSCTAAGGHGREHLCR